MGEGRAHPLISPQLITGTNVSVWGFVRGVLVPPPTSRTPSRFCLEPRTLRSAQTPTDWATIVSYDTGVLQACLALVSSLLEGCKEAANLSASTVYRRCNLLGLNCFAIIFSSSQKQTDDFHESMKQTRVYTVKITWLSPTARPRTALVGQNSLHEPLLLCCSAPASWCLSNSCAPLDGLR